jgi:hypothetical protein
MISETIARHRSVEKLGGSGMGLVYKAPDTELGRFIALIRTRCGSTQIAARGNMPFCAFVSTDSPDWCFGDFH